MTNWAAGACQAETGGRTPGKVRTPGADSPGGDVTTMTATCPAWCTKKEPHEPSDFHFGFIGAVGDTRVMLCYAGTRYGTPWDAPRVHVFHLCPASRQGLLLKHSDALDLADLLQCLNHRKLAGLVQKAAAMAATDGGDDA